MSSAESSIYDVYLEFKGKHWSRLVPPSACTQTRATPFPLDIGVPCTDHAPQTTPASDHAHLRPRPLVPHLSPNTTSGPGVCHSSCCRSRTPMSSKQDILYLLGFHSYRNEIDSFRNIIEIILISYRNNSYRNAAYVLQFWLFLPSAMFLRFI